ncbi:hypothetical protein [Virgibacillus doumboii]|uniref:hypothetical protein n=1 Tax=Virgibacillus doumboii TaxID=2697503 RepID=UPI0013DE8A35|nr:hypothetical protein [Virgibacillus doumboii]
MLVIFVVTACSTETKDENITTIETVLTNTFTGPDEELIKIWSDLRESSSEKEEFTKSAEALNNYSEGQFKPYFTEPMYLGIK